MSYEEKSAMRLFGAFSGVDEVYLAACEEDNGAGEARVSGPAVFVHRYGRAMAAALCLVVLGAGFLGYQTDRFADKSADYNAGGAADMISMERAPAEEAADEPEMGYNSIYAPESAQQEAQTEENMTDGIGSDGESWKKNSDSELQAYSGNASDQSNVLTDVLKAELAAGREITLDEARKLLVVGDYLPDIWPEQGNVAQVSCNDAQGNEALVVGWSYGEGKGGFRLTITNLGDIASEENAIEGYPVYKAEEFSRECVEENIAGQSDGRNDKDVANVALGSFGVLYRTRDEACVSVRFEGSGSVDEIWEMMSSIGGR